MKQDILIMEIIILTFTFHPKFSKNVHKRDCPVVLPPQGPKFRKLHRYYILIKINKIMQTFTPIQINNNK